MKIFIVLDEQKNPLDVKLTEKGALDRKSRYEHNATIESGKEATISTFDLDVPVSVLCDSNGQPVGVYSHLDIAKCHDAPGRSLRFFAIDGAPIVDGGVPA